MKPRYRVTLTAEERKELEAFDQDRQDECQAISLRTGFAPLRRCSGWSGLGGRPKWRRLWGSPLARSST